MSPASCPHVVIVGAGFAGLWAARALARKPVRVTLVDRNNYHVFLPLLYQVSAAEIEPEDIAYPIRSILRKMPNVSFDLAEVKRIAVANQTVQCEDHDIHYDYLILAAGSSSNFFGIAGAQEYAFPLKGMEEGIALRNHILSRFEHALHEPDPDVRRRRLTSVIVGGGPTGVEFAGALAELVQGPLRKDFPGLDFRSVRILLLEAKDSILDMLPDSLRDYARRRLQRMGVEVLLQAAVSEVNPKAVYLKDGTIIDTETVVWTAGVRGDFFSQLPELPVLANGRVAVLPTLQTPQLPNVYVAGDLAALNSNGMPLPMVAPVAIAQGVHAARNVLRQVAGKPVLPYRYRDKGTLVTIGRNSGVARIGRRAISGFAAWMLWVLVHLFKLVGFRNRLLVLIDWAWDYLFFERSVRLILPSATGEKYCE